MTTLTPDKRRALRASAHALDPVVAIGQHGLTPAVLHEIDVALTAHELIKIRVFGDDRDARDTLMARICADLACAPVQHIGKLLVVWRPRPDRKDDARTAKPATAKRPRDAKARRPAAAPRATPPKARGRAAPATDAPDTRAPRLGRRERGGAAAAPATRRAPAPRRRRGFAK